MMIGRRAREREREMRVADVINAVTCTYGEGEGRRRVQREGHRVLNVYVCVLCGQMYLKGICVSDLRR